MIDIAKAQELLEHHFATVTHEEFLANLQKFSPELFEEEQNDLTSDREIESKIEREHQEDINSQPLANTEIYQKAKEDNKLEIAPKLLQKGLSVEEVAEILGLDIHSISNTL